jgi:tetratricopeptide (TPR) repeat protein
MGKGMRGVLACGLLGMALLIQPAVPAHEDKSSQPTAEEKQRADKAAKLNEEGVQLYGMGKPKEAAEKFAEALALRRQLYPPERFPDGHTELAQSLSNLGAVLQALGQPAKALTYHEQALAMRRKLYPPARFKDGHPDLALSLSNLGYVLQALGQPAKALDYYEQALAMHRKLGRRETGKASESQALAYRHALQQLLPQNGYLSAAAQVPPSATLYAPLWPTRGGLLSLLQVRHQPVLAHVTASADARKHYDDLVATRQKISRLQGTQPADHVIDV